MTGIYIADPQIRAEQVEGERRVHRVAKGIEDRRHVAVDAGGLVPDVALRQGEVLGERSGAVDAHAARRLAEVPSAREA